MRKSSDSYSQINVLKKLIKLNKKYYLRYIFICSLALVLSVVGVVEAEALRKMVNGATSIDRTLLITGIVLFLSLLILSTFLDWYRVYLTSKLNLEATSELQLKVIDKLNNSKIPSFQRFHSGDLISRINDSVTMAQTGLNQQMVQIILNTGTVIFLIIYLSILNWQLTLLIIIFSGILPIFTSFFSNKIRKHYDRLQKEEAEYQSFLQESFQGVEVVKSFSLISLYINKLKKIYTKMIISFKKLTFNEAMINQLSLIIIVGGMVLVLGYGGRMVFIGQLDLGALIAFLVSFERIIQPISALFNSWPQLQKSISAAKRVFDILEVEEEVKTSSKTESLPLHNGSVLKFDNVYYQYDGSAEIAINELNMKFEMGKKIAIVGPSGGGKSTVLKLLMQFIQPLKGDILYNKLSISNIPIDEWRNNIAYVSQETILFTDSIFDNIKYGSPNATEEQVIQAAKSANIHKEIIKMKSGYHTMLKENGSNLSGGQRQRMALARALLREPLIFIFDEPTSSLDGVTEKKFQETLDKLVSEKNSIYIIVSHRLSMIQNADYIYVIKKGKLIEEGMHFDLCRQRGLYNQFTELDA